MIELLVWQIKLSLNGFFLLKKIKMNYIFLHFIHIFWLVLCFFHLLKKKRKKTHFVCEIRVIKIYTTSKENVFFLLYFHFNFINSFSFKHDKKKQVLLTAFFHYNEKNSVKYIPHHFLIMTLHFKKNYFSFKLIKCILNFRIP